MEIFFLTQNVENKYYFFQQLIKINYWKNKTKNWAIMAQLNFVILLRDQKLVEIFFGYTAYA